MSSSKRLFTNRQNTPLTRDDGEVIFHSRSVAVLAMVIARDATTNTFYALVGKRGAAVDHSGLWCMVCGYLDWDESLADAVRREVYEESGVDLMALEEAGHLSIPDQPVYVGSEVDAHRQNVTARFLVSIGPRREASTAHAEPGEVDAVEWIELDRAAIADRAWAFSHDALLNDFADWYALARKNGTLDGTSTKKLERAIREGRVW